MAIENLPAFKSEVDQRLSTHLTRIRNINDEITGLKKQLNDAKAEDKALKQMIETKTTELREEINALDEKTNKLKLTDAEKKNLSYLRESLDVYLSVTTLETEMYPLTIEVKKYNKNMFGITTNEEVNDPVREALRDKLVGLLGEVLSLEDKQKLRGWVAEQYKDKMISMPFPFRDFVHDFLGEKLKDGVKAARDLAMKTVGRISWIYSELKAKFPLETKLVDASRVTFNDDDVQGRVGAIGTAELDTQGRTDARSIREAYLKAEPDILGEVNKKLGAFREEEDIRQGLRELFFEVSFLKSRVRPDNPSSTTINAYYEQVLRLMGKMRMPAPMTEVAPQRGGDPEKDKRDKERLEKADEAERKKKINEQKKKEKDKEAKEQAAQEAAEKKQEEQVQERIRKASGLSGDAKTESFDTLREAFRHLTSLYRTAIGDITREIETIQATIGDTTKLKDIGPTSFQALQKRLNEIDGDLQGKSILVDQMWTSIVDLMRRARDKTTDEDTKARIVGMLDALAGDAPEAGAALPEKDVTMYRKMAALRPELSTKVRQVTLAIKGLTKLNLTKKENGGKDVTVGDVAESSAKLVENEVEKLNETVKELTLATEHLRETVVEILSEVDEEVQDATANGTGAPGERPTGGPGAAPAFEAPPNHPIVKMLEEFRKRHRRDPDGANDALVTRVRMTGIDPEVMRPNLRDRVIFVGMTFGIRILALTVTDALLRWNAIRSVHGAFAVFTTLYTAGVIAAFVAVNTSGPDIRTNFTYLNVNSGGTAAVHVLINLGLSWVILDLLSRNETVNWRSAKLSPGERGRISYKLGTMSFVAWAMLAVITLAV